ncbi:MAG: hypothetical protein M3Q99_05345 [Acidobacteriota bacterium]|nr:hypothetical protein [Acidobacteriota bacterium]
MVEIGRKRWINMSKGKTISLFIIAICFGLASCQSVEKIIDSNKKPQKEFVTKVYEKNELNFSYGDNWRISEDTILEDGIRFVQVEDSDNTLFIITIPKSGNTIDLGEYSENFIKGLASEIPIGKITKVKSSKVNRIINNKQYTGIRKNFSIALLGEDIPHTSDFFLITQQDTDAVITIQAPDEDLNVADKEIQVIADSLKLN